MSVTDWGEIIRRQGEERRIADEKKLAELEERLPLEIKALADLDDVALLDHYTHHKNSGYNTIFLKIHLQMAKAAKDLILMRMAK